jgi:hypothetical protein
VGVPADVQGNCFRAQPAERAARSGEDAGNIEIHFETRRGAIYLEGRIGSVRQAEFVNDYWPQEWRFDSFCFNTKSLLASDRRHPQTQAAGDEERREGDDQTARHDKRHAKKDQESFETHCGSML